jgi:hypothetical protein
MKRYVQYPKKSIEEIAPIKASHASIKNVAFTEDEDIHFGYAETQPRFYGDLKGLFNSREKNKIGSRVL